MFNSKFTYQTTHSQELTTVPFRLNWFGLVKTKPIIVNNRHSHFGLAKSPPFVQNLVWGVFLFLLCGNRSGHFLRITLLHSFLPFLMWNPKSVPCEKNHREAIFFWNKWFFVWKASRAKKQKQNHLLQKARKQNKKHIEDLFAIISFLFPIRNPKLGNERLDFGAQKRRIIVFSWNKRCLYDKKA